MGSAGVGIERGVAFVGVTVLDGVVGFSADIVRRAEISDADTGGGCGIEVNDPTA